MVYWVAKRQELPGYPEVALTLPRPWRWVESGESTKKKSSEDFSFFGYISVFVYARMPTSQVWVWQSDDILGKLGFALHPVGPDIKLGLAGWCLYPVSYLAFACPLFWEWGWG